MITKICSEVHTLDKRIYLYLIDSENLPRIRSNHKYSRSVTDKKIRGQIAKYQSSELVKNYDLCVKRSLVFKQYSRSERKT